MSTFSTQPAPIFADPAGLYTGGYTSNIRHPNTARGSNQRGIIQVIITTQGDTVDFQGKVHPDAPWVTVKSYSANTIEEAVLMPHMRVVTSAASDEIKVYITESK